MDIMGDTMTNENDVTRTARHANDDPNTDDVSWLEHYRNAYDETVHDDELANAGLWHTLDELTDQRAMNVIGDAIDGIGIQPVERCAYCDNVATEICDTCGASLCHDHVVTMGHVVVDDGIEIPCTYCRKFACIAGTPVGVVPYITCA